MKTYLRYGPIAIAVWILQAGFTQSLSKLEEYLPRQWLE